MLASYVDVKSRVGNQGAQSLNIDCHQLLPELL